jgi:hypothetical protein
MALSTCIKSQKGIHTTQRGISKYSGGDAAQNTPHVPDRCLADFRFLLTTRAGQHLQTYGMRGRVTCNDYAKLRKLRRFRS